MSISRMFLPKAWKPPMEGNLEAKDSVQLGRKELLQLLLLSKGKWIPHQVLALEKVTKETSLPQ